MTEFYIGQRYFAGHLGGNICVVFILKAYFIVSDIPDDKIADVTLVNAMLVRGSGAIESRFARNQVKVVKWGSNVANIKNRQFKYHNLPEY